MSKPLVTPRTLKGFRDYLPEAMLAREGLIDTARRVYRSYGYAPIDTPALEYLEVLRGKGSDETDKQLYAFQDNGGRDVGLRFDLTVPLARFAAEHTGELGLPFKRYHIASVWRGENTQRGRYREFMQCDFDTIGAVGPASDIETLLVTSDLFAAIGFDAVTIRINHRGVLGGMLEAIGLAEQATSVLRALDKLAKIGPEKVRAEIEQAAGATATQSAKIVALAGVSGDTYTVLQKLEAMVAGPAGKSEAGAAGVARLRDVLDGVAAAGVPPGRIKIDPSIARGLDYYTGLVFETTLDALPGIGSVASGGRYDNLAALFTKQELPGIGGSLGLDRLLAAMEELKMLPATRTPAPVFMPLFADECLAGVLKLAAELRSAGIGVEVYSEPKKLSKQLQYADKKGFRVAVIAGQDELAKGEAQVKDLANGQSVTASAAGLLDEVRRVLDGQE
ncbi:Histidine--tRNA ligase [Pirellulimonas nuda]|uniref:Histidine--tRNA ligase n=1 Tax=Pirellulimonas nuda TaxID=2528009 RepID=A0A518D5L8_9BACT|nr:histidine--tRNA ligase [Pirellulimonas nuda]QDU86760.1 Histidine--tRNA ligase [Pirellulimonas nuda]